MSAKKPLSASGEASLHLSLLSWSDLLDEWFERSHRGNVEISRSLLDELRTDLRLAAREIRAASQ